VTSFLGVLANPWAILQFAHNMSGSVITGAFVMAAVGAFYLLENKFAEHGRLFLQVGVSAGLIFSILQIFPTGDLHGKYMARQQPVTTAAMEALFRTESGAPIVILGQPDEEHERIDNPLIVNKVLSFLIYGTSTAEVKGLNEFSKSDWPGNLPLLYYSYHLMAGLGTIFVAVMVVAGFLLWRKRLYEQRWMLWIIMLCVPLPYIANTAGWLTAEIGRQPWVVYGLMRTTEGYSHTVHAGNGLFTLLGFMGMYTMIAILFLFLMHHEIANGPGGETRSVETGQPITLA
jgi:cytochrome d ubiquinol oxidase subunit I